MSSSAENDLRSALDDAGARLRSGDALLAPVRRLAFWTAVALPFLYVPLLFVGTNDPGTTGTTNLAILVLLTCNALALFVGHPYQRE